MSTGWGMTTMNHDLATPADGEWVGGEPQVLVFDVNETLIDFESLTRSSRGSSATRASCASGSVT